MWAAFRELDRVVKRYATATLTLLFVVIGPATADQPAPAGPPAAGSGVRNVRQTMSATSRRYASHTAASPAATAG